MNLKQDHHAFNALHAVYHERDFRVRVNDPTVEMVRRAMEICLGGPFKKAGCPGCVAGFDIEPHSVLAPMDTSEND